MSGYLLTLFGYFHSSNFWIILLDCLSKFFAYGKSSVLHSRFRYLLFQWVVFEHNTPSERCIVLEGFQRNRSVTHSIRVTSVEVRAVSRSPFIPRYIPADPPTTLWNDDPSVVAVACSQSCHRAFRRMRQSASFWDGVICASL